jgi:hypothetical protein
MSLSLEMRRSAGTKKLEALKRRRGVATVDDAAGQFVILSKQIVEVESDIAAIDQARAEADAEAARRRAADEPRRRKEAHERRLAEVEGLETERLAAVAEAEAAAKAMVVALTRAQAAAKRLDKTCPETLVREPNHSMRLSERLASALLPLASGSGFWGHLSLGPAMHAHLAPDHNWVAGERVQFAGILEMLRRP